tara:strand:+ start:2070 stop:2495 length:426 start_codon:yes stop_codon:yes gene_type:complete
VKSHINIELIESYRYTNYRVITDPNAITLLIDHFSEPLSQLITASNPPCAALISAYNPFSQCHSQEENLTAHKRLGQALRHDSNQIIESTNLDPSGRWPPERSLLALGLNLDTAKTIGRQFYQNAIIWISKDAIPRLILLR